MKTSLIFATLAACLVWPNAALAQNDDCGVPMLLDAQKNVHQSGYAYVKVWNNTDCEATIGLPVFEAIDPSRPLTQDNQKLFAESVGTVRPGFLLELFTPIPPCEFQYDPNHGMGSVGPLGSRPNFGQGQHLYDISELGGHFGGSRCAPSEPEPVPEPTPYFPEPVANPVDVLPLVCPVITPDNVWSFVSHVSVNLTESGAWAGFIVSGLPNGCYIELSLGSYVKQGCEARFPQQLIDGVWAWFGNGQWSFDRHINRTETLFQIDLRLNAFWHFDDFTLTQEREDEYYAQRTLEWRGDWTGCGE
jgi:hypothetical protein